MQTIIEWIGAHLWTIVVIISIFIQIAPIKIKPFTALFKWISNITNQEINKDLRDLKKTVEAQGKTIDENEKDRIRYEVLNFANSCHNGRRHTEDEFKHIIALNDKYKALLEKTNDKNGVFDVEYEYVHNLYLKLQGKHAFLATSQEQEG